MRRRRLSVETLDNRLLLTSLVDSLVVEDQLTPSITIIAGRVDPVADDGPT